MDEEEKEIKALDEKDIALLKSYGQGQYTKALKVYEKKFQQHTVKTCPLGCGNRHRRNIQASE